MGGGTGQFAVLSGLKEISDVEVTAIVTMADSGGSSGVLRTERGVLPPGDILRCLLALATADEDTVALFGHRLAEGGGVGGHTFGNLAITSAAEQHEGNFLVGIETIAKVLQARGRVLPVTLSTVELHAQLSDGTEVHGEHEIDRGGWREGVRIERVWLEPTAPPLLEAVEAIRNADAIVVGPGDLYTSIIPNVLVDGIPLALRHAGCPIIFVVNAMTKRGETDGFCIGDFVETFERYVGLAVDAVIYNTRPPSDDLLDRYAREGARWVPASERADGGIRGPRRIVVPFPLLSDGPLVRHDPVKLAHVIRALL